MKTVHEHYVVDAAGKKTGVILSLARYEQLLEDLHDLAVVAERREEEPISLGEMERRRKTDRVIGLGSDHRCLHPRTRHSWAR